MGWRWEGGRQVWCAAQHITHTPGVNGVTGVHVSNQWGGSVAQRPTPRQHGHPPQHTCHPMQQARARRHTRPAQRAGSRAQKCPYSLGDVGGWVVALKHTTRGEAVRHPHTQPPRTLPTGQHHHSHTVAPHHPAAGSDHTRGSAWSQWEEDVGSARGSKTSNGRRCVNRLLFGCCVMIR